MILQTRKRRRWFFLISLLFTFHLPTNAQFDDQSLEQETQTVVPMRSPIDCDFDLKLNNNGMCSWRTVEDDEDQKSGKGSIWHTGNSVLVDSANSIVKSAMGDDRFAFVQGHFGAASEASLESQILRNAPGITNQLQFSYWKATFGPTLDVCLKTVVDSKLQCIDSITGAGNQQWTQRTLALPRLNEPFRIIFRARNVHSAEDLIGLDDIRLRMADDELQSVETSPLLTSTSSTKKNNKSYLDKKQESSVLSNFEMRRSQAKSSSNVIQPAVQRSQPPIALDEQRLPIQDDDDPPQLTPIVKPANAPPKSRINSHQQQTTTTTTHLPPTPNILFHHHSPIPNSKKIESTFPDFPSFENNHLGASLNPMSLGKVSKMEDTESCKAVKCSFLDTSCLWILGKSWKLGQGNIAIESTGEDIIRSGYFKAPLATFLEFDLWMSDDANLFVVQETQEVGMPGTDELSLFSRRGMANNGWHRFRVPLRPSFNSIRLKIRALLPNQNAFVTLSNTRLVSANGEEANCETTPGVFMASVGDQWSAGVPLMNGVLQTGGLTTMSGSDADPTTMTPFLASISPLATGTPPLSGNPFSLPVMTAPPPLEFMKNLDAGVQAFQQQQQQQQQSSSGMMVDGVTPITPVRDNFSQRLTAFQKMPQQQFTFPTLPPFPSLFDPPFQPSSFLGQNQQKVVSRPATSTHEPPPPDPFSDTDLVSTTTRDSLSLKEINDNEAASFTEPNESFPKDNQISPTAGRDITRIIGDVASQPNGEQKIRQLAQQFGIDIEKFANGKQLAALRRVLNGQRPLNLPSSVGQTLNDNDTGSAKPIKPEGVSEQDFERVIQQEAQKRLVGHSINGDMLKKLAKLLNLAPNNPVDHDSPMARDNLDFIFQNAMMNG